jgi:hypothetical protein
LVLAKGRSFRADTPHRNKDTVDNLNQESCTEIYVNTGNADFPFERIQGGYLEIGCGAKHSIARLSGPRSAVFWLGQSEEGEKGVFMASGYTPQKISTHAIDEAIETYADPSSATGYTYSSKGHDFYVLNFAEATWVYDLSTGLWHKRESFGDSGTSGRHRGETHCYDETTKLHLIGDYSNNKVYYYDDDYFADDTEEIRRERAFPYISANGDRLTCSELEIEMEVGVGLDGGVQGADPKIVLQWSDDDGATWSNEQWTSIGKIGERRTRVRWRRLGQFRYRIFRIQISDKVKVRIVSANIKVERARS